MKKSREAKSVILRSNLEKIDNIFELEKIGAGHDGEIYKYKDLVLKLLKYDMETRKQRKLMTFDKALYFQDLGLKRITNPIDILLDKDGIYTGYVMNYLKDLSNPKICKDGKIKTIGDYTLEQLLEAMDELSDDFAKLSDKKIVGMDINRGSFLLTSDFLHLCDMDKYQIVSSNATSLNAKNLKFVISKLIYFEMMYLDFIDKEDRAKLLKWVKYCCNSSDFLSNIASELKLSSSKSIHEFAIDKSKKLLLK